MRYPICDQLQNLKKEGRIPFHMPGHKRKNIPVFQDITSMDITEITGYDNLHHPEEMIAESMDLLKSIYHTQKSWYLINGSTVGILACISALCQPGDYILVARNCHKAVYNAIRLLHLHPIYLYPSYDEKYDMLQGIGEEEQRKIDEYLRRYADIKAVFITSPTYEGVVSDISSIADIVHSYHIPLIVDEAHGAHFIFDEYFPKSAVEMGADLVIQSAHKTLPSFTQTALLHLCSNRISASRIEEMLSIYETSSPSYLLLASAEYGVIYSQEHKEKMQDYVDNLKKFRLSCAKLKNIHLLTPEDVCGYDYDRGKLVLLVDHKVIDGKELFHQMLERFHIEFEMETAFYCIAMTSIMDEKEDFDCLYAALSIIDEEISRKININTMISEKDKEREIEKSIFSFQPEKEMEVWEAIGKEKESIEFDMAVGKTVGQYIYLYPPGIPILVPGEKIEKEMVENIRYYLYNGYNVPSVCKGQIEIVK